MESQTEAQPSVRTGVNGSSLDAAYAEWMKADRKAGDVEVFADAEEDPAGYTVVMYLSREDNHYPTANVRHSLIRVEADAYGNYTDEAKEAAKARAEELLAEFEAGDRSEESFAVLAQQYSEDSGSNTNGGLYESVAKGQMVEEFDAFCFGGHQPGDTAIVYGTNGAYAGYHVMYYSGDGPLYSSHLAKTDLQTGAMESWLGELTENVSIEEGEDFYLVGDAP